jgi:hypothetical protein
VRPKGRQARADLLLGFVSVQVLLRDRDFIASARADVNELNRDVVPYALDMSIMPEFPVVGDLADAEEIAGLVCVRVRKVPVNVIRGSVADIDARDLSSILGRRSRNVCS